MERIPARTRAPWGGWWARHPRALRGLAVLALAWMAVYLVWRIGWSLSGENVVLWAALLVAELFGFLSLAALAWFGWRGSVVERPPAGAPKTVDVYICTYDEPLSVLRATLAGCAALRHPHTTYVLDDGRRPQVRELARHWGARYLTRPDNAHAKAGNINAALPRTSGDLVLTLDADHVPMPDAIDAIAPYFDDERFAVVQTPHDFSNHDSIQHYEVGRHEQSIFFGVVLPGKDRHGAAFWCGSAAMIRRAALMEIGGVATETIAEDFHTTIRMQRHGWRTRYHDEILVQGLAPHDLDGYLLQRDRWARGNLAVLSTPESPLRARELTRRQRLSHAASLFAYLAGPIRLLLLAVLAAVLWTGALPFHASALTIGVLWAPATFLAIAAGSALGRGYQAIADTTHFELLTAEIHLRALRCAVVPGRTAFKVTPKEGLDAGGWPAVQRLHLLLAMSVLLGGGLVVRLLDESGAIPMPGHLTGMALWLIPVLGVVELHRVVRTLRLVHRRSQRRAEYRVPLQGAARLELPGAPARLARLVDGSPLGVALVADAPVEVGARPRLTIHAAAADGVARRLELVMDVRSARACAEGWVLGGTVTPCSDADERGLVELCCVVQPWGRVRPEIAPAIESPVARPAAAAPAGPRPAEPRRVAHG